jgi:pseudaminic acid synthase
MKEFNIGSYTIGLTQKPFIIAEMSGNHNQSLERALKIIDVAAESGAHAIKLQTYTADTITMKGVYSIADKNSLWHGQELYDLYKQAYTPWEWHKAIFDRAHEKGILAFSSPFDETAVDFLETLNVPVYKIASFENTHIPLIKKIAKTGKPVILSTGVSTISDIDLAVKTLRNNGCENFILLKCTSTYPSTPENSNVLTLPHLSQLFGCYVGLSDHTMGIGASIAAVALGARVIEKHFTLNRSDGGVDSAFSLEPHEFKSLVIETERAFQSLGTVKYGVQLPEEKSKLFKRSIYISKDIKKGEIFTIENLKIIRPSYGLHPKYYEMVLGRKCKIDLTAGTPLTIDCLID